MSIFLTGDIHGDIYPRLNTKNFPAQKELSKQDYVIILGDFGIPWCQDKSDAYAIKELENRPFTTLFIDGNHDNFDILNQYPVETWNGGHIHRIRPSIIHLMRGQVFTLEDHTFFTFGGASSHDISDGILKQDDPFLKQKIRQLKAQNKNFYRIDHLNWWKEELPSKEELEEGLKNLTEHHFQVDFILTHTPPNSILGQMGYASHDELTDYLQDIKQRTEFKRWYFGHMHQDRPFYWDRCIGMYESITQIL